MGLRASPMFAILVMFVVAVGCLRYCNIFLVFRLPQKIANVLWGGVAVSRRVPSPLIAPPTWISAMLCLPLLVHSSF